MPDDLAVQVLQREVLELRSVLTSLTRVPTATESSTRRKSTSSSTIVKETATISPFTIFPPDQQTELASGTEEQASAPVDLSSVLPAGATYAYLRFSGHATEDGRTLAMRHRPSTEGGWATALHIVAIEDAADTSSNDNSEWVVLAGDLSFHLEVVTDAPAAWSVTLLGYA